MKTNDVKELIRSEAGSALIAGVLIAAAVVITFTYAISESVYHYRKVSQSFQFGRKYRMALGNVIDYTTFAIRERWCLNSDLSQAKDCDLTSNGALERLVLLPQTIDQLNQERQQAFQRAVELALTEGTPAPTNSPDPIEAMEKFIGRIYLNQTEGTGFPPNHPLYDSVEALKKDFSQIIVTVWKTGEGISAAEVQDVKSFTPLGNEAILKIRVETAGSGGLFPHEISSESLIALTPREVNSFALIAQGDLVLDQQYTPKTNDLVFPALSSCTFNYPRYGTEKATTGDVNGLYFQSPVFTNGNLILPSVQTYNSAPCETTGTGGIRKNEYYHVHFADTVVVGSGRIWRDNKPFVPASPGGAGNDFNFELKNYGMVELAQGIHQDSAADPGLPYLFGDPMLSTDLLLACKEWAAIKSSFVHTAKSTLLVKQLAEPVTTGTDVLYQFQLGLSHENKFVAQTRTTPKVGTETDFSTSAYKGLQPDHPELYLTPATLAGSPMIKVHLGDTQEYPTHTTEMWVTLPVPASATIPIAPLDFEQAVTTIENSMTPIRAELCNSYGTAGISPLPSFCTAGGALSSPTCDVSAPACKVAKDLYDAKAADYGAKLAALATAKAELLTAQTNAGSIVITTSPSDPDRGDVFNISIKFNNIRNFPTKTASGSNFGVQVQLEAYDVATTGDGIFIRGAAAGPGPNDTDPKNRNELFFPITGTKGAASINTSAAPLLSSYSPPVPTQIGVWASGRPATIRQGAAWTFKPTFPGQLPSNLGDLPDGNHDPEKLDTEDCMLATGAGDVVFPLDSYSDFYKNSLYSWNFSPPISPQDPSNPDAQPPVAGNLIIAVDTAKIFPLSYRVTRGAISETIIIEQDVTSEDASKRTMVVSHKAFQVYSVADVCIIERDVELVAGFLTCKKLIIPDRSKFLRIRGTLILGEIKISSSAIAAGILWSSIWHPEAEGELQGIKMLTQSSDGETLCSTKNTVMPTRPIWDPTYPTADLDKVVGCQVGTLRKKADPFRWTSVDPDCGIPNDKYTADQSLCRAQYRAKHLNTAEIWRKDSL